MLKVTLRGSTLLFRVGAALTHLLALVVVVDGTRLIKLYFSPDQPLLSWARFALHPLLMIIAFGFFAPLGAMSFRVYHGYLGIPYAVVGQVHLALTTAAVLLGLLGIWDMWIVHSHGEGHFQSAHSWIGMAVMLAFTWQWLGGLLVLRESATGLVPAAQRKADARAQRTTHALVGAFSLYGGIGAMLTGTLSLAGRGDNADPKDLGFKWFSLYVLALGVAVGLFFGGPTPFQFTAVMSESSPIAIGVTVGDAVVASQMVDVAPAAPVRKAPVAKGPVAKGPVAIPTAPSPTPAAKASEAATKADAAALEPKGQFEC